MKNLTDSIQEILDAEARSQEIIAAANQKVSEIEAQTLAQIEKIKRDYAQAIEKQVAGVSVEENSAKNGTTRSSVDAKKIQAATKYVLGKLDTFYL